MRRPTCGGTSDTDTMTNSDTDPVLREVALDAARTSDAGAELLSSLTGMGHSIRAARTAGRPIAGIGRELIQGRAQARYRRAQDRIRPSIRLAEHSAEVIAAASACGFSSVRVFGSCARGEDTLNSDVDLIVTISEHTSLLDFVRFTDQVEDLLNLARGRVDLLDDDALRPGSASGARIAREMQPLTAWAKGWPRLEALPAAARRSCVLELIATARACAAVGRFERLAITLAAWRGTAEVYADPAIALDGSDLEYLYE